MAWDGLYLNRHILYRHIVQFGMECITAGHILYRHIARFGMECISAGHILYLRPSISRLSTSARPPHHPSTYIHHHQKLHHHLHRHPRLKSINFFPSLSDTFLSRKVRRSLDRNCFSILNFLQCSARASPSTVDIVVSFWFGSTEPPPRCTVDLLADLTDIE